MSTINSVEHHPEGCCVTTGRKLVIIYHPLHLTIQAEPVSGEPDDEDTAESFSVHPHEVDALVEMLRSAQNWQSGKPYRGGAK
jgi:hypothetical protein